MGLIKPEWKAVLKKEWRTLSVGVWLFLITIFLLCINSQLGALKHQSAKMASTIDSVESLAIGTDAQMVDMTKKMDGITSNMEFMVTKARRR